jgi:hypothetical protein
METITPQSDLLAYYGDRLIYIEDDVHKTCIVDYTVILSIALKRESYKVFWRICYKRHLKLMKEREKLNVERQMEYDKANVLGRALHNHYEKWI